MDDVIRRMVDERGIERLLHRYCRLVDDGHTDAIAVLFEDDAELDLMGRTFSGRHAIAAVFAEAGGPFDRPSTTHVLSNVQIDPRSEEANCVSDLTVVTRAEDGGFRVTLAARYHDHVLRAADADDGWRFASRRVVVHARSGSAR